MMCLPGSPVGGTAEVSVRAVSIFKSNMFSVSIGLQPGLSLVTDCICAIHGQDLKVQPERWCQAA